MINDSEYHAAVDELGGWFVLVLVAAILLTLGSLVGIPVLLNWWFGEIGGLVGIAIDAVIFAWGLAAYETNVQKGIYRDI